ncbi:MAG: prolipoprotein diacylglyceryl transferase [Candidatus Omnitrophica bacterium]|nr:prolipoprotein diacylglyceryl transferase [Candidatus Omnitrophota bacterium]
MHPILFQLGPIKFYSYGLMLALAFITATYLAKEEAQRQGIAADKIVDLSLGLAICGVLGARLLYILQNLKFYLASPLEIIKLNQGGLSFYGGLFAASIFAVIFLKQKQLPWLGTLNLLSPYLALGQAIGRIGCFLNGCCYGIAGVPVQLYSALGLLLIFIILRLRMSFLLYCLLYSLFRFLIEFLRADNLRIWANLTLHQLISLGIFIIALVIWLRRCKNSD